MVDRRTLLKQLGLVASGAIILPACDFTFRKVSVALKNLSITVEQEDLVKKLVNTIITSDELLGAADLSVDKFVWIMVDDCLKQKQQEEFKSGLENFVPYSLTTTTEEKGFQDMEPEECLNFLQETLAKKAPKPPLLPSLENEEQAKEIPPDRYLQHIQYFIQTVRRYTIQGYLQSEYVMRKVMPYELVPSNLNLCKPIDPMKKININA